MIYEFENIKKNKEILQPKSLCNYCGNEFSTYKIEKFKYVYGYYSKRDLDMLDLKICVECLDKLTDKLINECKVNPVLEWTGDPNNPYEI